MPRKGKKRGNGEGAIYFDDSRRLWVARLHFTEPDTGIKRSRTVYGKTRREADDKLDALKVDRSRTALCVPSTATLGSWLDAWLADIVQVNQRARTHRKYSQIVRLHINPRAGSLKLSTLTAAAIQSLYGELARAGKSARLQLMVHTVLHRALKIARKRRLIGSNPCDDVERPKAESKEMTALTPEEAGKLIRAARGQRLESLFIVAVTTGARQGELFALRWEDVDLDVGTLSVRRTVAEIDGRFVENPPKTKSGRRMVVLSPLGVQALRDHLRRMFAEGRVAPDRLVFCDETGGYLRGQNVARRTLARILKAAKLPTIRFHDLRHTAATLRLASGDNPKVVQELLGHADIGTTMNIYSHVLPTMQRESAARIDRLLTASSEAAVG